ncbi:MAG: hypothetical protein AAGD23_07240 [Pseudomonadota bacterium]
MRNPALLDLLAANLCLVVGSRSADIAAPIAMAREVALPPWPLQATIQSKVFGLLVDCFLSVTGTSSAPSPWLLRSSGQATLLKPPGAQVDFSPPSIVTDCPAPVAVPLVIAVPARARKTTIEIQILRIAGDRVPRISVAALCRSLVGRQQKETRGDYE